MTNPECSLIERAERVLLRVSAALSQSCIDQLDEGLMVEWEEVENDLRSYLNSSSRSTQVH